MGPDMCMERNYAAANVVGGKIYVAGGCKGCDKSNWMEVFDAKMHIWELVSCPMKDLCGCDICISAGMNGKVFTFGKGNAVGKCRGLAYLPKENTWTQALWEADIGSYKVIKNVLYYYHSGEFEWKDIRKRIGVI
ncbi:hypothetical protein AALP_AA4G143500 [Arabis alpina]|uniref:FKB95-like N-terminal Kelch domain-containing protein n=1 Tax=Arabis alpina TaxID=50452 RepID=A0A087H388_ARAAL|nr:hypothetical protein AALP_AA4G143500 [Arabis alpina]